MAKRIHCNKDPGETCSCEMGKIYRFAEPIILLAIARLGNAYGYSITQEAQKLRITHAGFDTGVIYRTLQRLNKTGQIVASWDTNTGKQARKLYELTDAGWMQIAEWTSVINDIIGSLSSLKEICVEAMLRHKSEAQE